MTQLAVSMKDVLREMNELKPAYESSVQDSAEGESKSQDSDDSFAGDNVAVDLLLESLLASGQHEGRAMTQLAVSMKDVLREMNELKPAYESSVQDSAEGESKSQDSDDSFAGDVGNDLSPEEMKIARLITDVVSCNTCGH
ncbi:hypothetical protein K7X08_021169 [Anisodus acutangulus]|uniref:Uncharacterized protein n=1 Tax=Anisodus acutangulus TaxID=402998 RepID=A0A9Q1M032_9SOLA|nr:hypothetical protein K7X08_021169 [Anisodus acutangulus]